MARKGRRESVLEWARVAPDCVVVATAARCFVHETSSVLGDADPFDEPMRGRGSLASTRLLFDGAIAAAKNEHPRPRRPPLTPARWLWRLAGSYRTTEATPRLMTEAARRFAAAGQPGLSRWATKKAREETGHERLALRDLEDLGFDARALVEHVMPDAALALVEHFTETVRGDDSRVGPLGAAGPIDCVGYAYMLERLALQRGAGAIAAVKDVLPPGVDATRCLRVHSAAGSDRAHVDETVRLVATLPPSVRAQVAAACFAAARVYYAPRVPLSEETLIQLLLPFRRRAVVHFEVQPNQEG